MNAVNWFEIPAIDFDRAVGFYETVLGVKLNRMDFAGDPNGIFPYDEQTGVGGAVAKTAYLTPNENGALVYLNAGTPDNLEAVLSRVEAAGGQVLTPKTHVGDPGWIAQIRDTEGNRVGLHTPNGN